MDTPESSAHAPACTARRRRRAALRRTAGSGVALAMLATAGCQLGTSESHRSSGELGSGGDNARSARTTERAPAVEVSANVDRRGVPVDTEVAVTAEHGRLTQVRVTRGPRERRLPGTLAEDASGWEASKLLEPGATYTIETRAVGSTGREVRDTQRFSTEDLTLDEQTYPNIAPLDGETVGVGMPVVVQFDVPVTDRAAIERRLRVESTPKVRGSWHWYSDTEVHFRPRDYWTPGSKVTVHADVNSVDAGNGVYGQLDRRISFTVGRSVVSKVHVRRHEMEVFVDGRLARTIPVTTGKAGFETRRGTKVVMEKFESKRMDAATTGISRDDPEYYNIANVQWALRVTYSGEFLHGAPWSSGDQGSANVSHGCVGMSLSDAKWLFDRTTRGDIVEVFGSPRTIEPGNGWTDWDVSFAQYRKGSALD